MYGDEDDETSGGHLHGLGRPDKSEFPQDWDEDKIAHEVKSVAGNPDMVNEWPDRWVATGIRDGVTIEVYVRPDGRIATGFPVDGPGIGRNPPTRGGV
ncbi:MAG: EndoU domain-containing protein [Micromonosporaceae bacterium]